MSPLYLVAGFTCGEGQQAASFKEFIFSTLAVGVVVFSLWWLWRNWKTQRGLRRLFTVTATVFVIVLTIGFVLAGPLLYNDWGCDSFGQQLFN